MHFKVGVVATTCFLEEVILSYFEIITKMKLYILDQYIFTLLHEARLLAYFTDNLTADV
jgi:hypothetical protein